VVEVATRYGGLPLWLSGGAAVASAAHIVVDFFADQYPATALAILLVGGSAAALYVVWGVALARIRRGSAGAVGASAVLAFWQAGLANGLAVLVACPPTVLIGGKATCELAPWQDLAHVASFAFGGAAFLALRRVGRPRPRPNPLKRAAIAVLIVHLALALIASTT
jgi:hypothetical protein